MMFKNILLVIVFLNKFYQIYMMCLIVVSKKKKNMRLIVPLLTTNSGDDHIQYKRQIRRGHSKLISTNKN